MSKRRNTEEFIKDSVEVHGDRYDYSKTVFTKLKDKVEIICDNHGSFFQTAYNHLQGSNCPKCASVYRNRAKMPTTEEFIEKSKEVHSGFYKYPKVDYINTHTKVSISCPLHGEFKQTPKRHLRGHGCKLCQYLNSSVKFKGWCNQCGDNPGIFYILRCWNDEEEFYKVGITCQDSIQDRYKGTFNMPYNFEIVKEVHSHNRRNIWDMELSMKKLNSKHLYEPKISFNGSSTECFTDIKYE